MIDIGYYYNYSSETIDYYYRKLKNKDMYFIMNIYAPPKDNIFFNI